MRTHELAAGIVLLAVAGCVGTVGESAAPSSPTPPGETAPSGNTGAGGAKGKGGSGGAAAGGGPGCASTTGAAAWRTTMLTREQYINTVSDLLGFDVRAEVRFEDGGSRKLVDGVSLTPLEVEQRQATAEAIAAAAASPAYLPLVLACDLARQGEAACVSQLVEHLPRRAFRRPPTAEGMAALRKLFDAGKAAGGFATGVEWVVAGVLQAPDFLYQTGAPTAGAKPGAVVPLDEHTLASRLSFFLWNSGPDAELLAAADSKTVHAGLEAQVRRMLASPRAARTREDYYSHWLKLDRLASVARDAREYTPALAADLRRSVLQGIHEVYRSGAKVETLWSAPSLFANNGLAKVYGLPAVATATALEPVAATPGQRFGLLTHPALLALLANADASDPIQRGVFVEEEVLCQTLPDPLPDVPELPRLRRGLSTRQRLEQHRSKPACATCHQLFDPIGMAFEGFDQIGRYRETDQGVPVDSSGEIRQGLDLDGKFANGMELLARIGSSGVVRDCMAERWMEYALRRDIGDSESCAAGAIKSRFRGNGDLVELLTAIASSDPFRTVLVEE